MNNREKWNIAIMILKKGNFVRPKIFHILGAPISVSNKKAG